jgi:hypothetical protein
MNEDHELAAAVEPDWAAREAEAMDQLFRHQALGLAVETVAAVRATGQPIARNATYRLADEYATYLRTGQHPPVED